MIFRIVGLNHKSSSRDIYELFPKKFDALLLLLQEAVAGKILPPLVPVSTCNRYEIVFDMEKYPQKRNKIITDVIHILDGAKTGLKLREIENSLVEYSGREATAHLFEVACGLESYYPGESAVVSQMREAYTRAVESHLTSPALDRFFSAAFRLARKIREKFGPVGEPYRMTSFAMKMAQDLLGTLREKRVLIVGNCAPVRLFRKKFETAGCSIFLFTKPARRYISLLKQEISVSDIVIFATDQTCNVLEREHMKDIIRYRGNRPIVLFDLSFSRDIQPAVRDEEGVFVFNIDELSPDSGVPEAKMNAEERVSAIRKIVRMEAENFDRACREAIFKKEISRYVESRLAEFPGLEKNSGRLFVKSLVKKIISETGRAGVLGNRKESFRIADEMISALPVNMN